MRIDIWLVENGFAPSRQKAQELIATGRVFQRDARGAKRPINKPSYIVTDDFSAGIHVEAAVGPQFVSRGGQKLFGAVSSLGLSSHFKDATVLDVGISTGGFSDCAFQLGARRVVGIDVGHGQLAASLRSDPRLTHFEGVNARELAQMKEKIVLSNGGELFDFIVVDVSFISLKLILPSLTSFLKESSAGSAGRLVALVKPQFEVGREGLGRGGIVKDVTLYPKVEASLRDVCASLGLRVESYVDSPILGSDGNREFFIYATVPQLGLF